MLWMATSMEIVQLFFLQLPRENSLKMLLMQSFEEHFNWNLLGSAFYPTRKSKESIHIIF